MNTESGPSTSTSQSTYQPHVNVYDSDTNFFPQEVEDMGWLATDIESENDYDGEVVAQETKDQACDWQPNAKSPDNDSNTVHGNEDGKLNCVPKDVDPHQSLRCFHPLSDSDDSDTPSSPPP
jgi:hypothetical protein